MSRINYRSDFKVLVTPILNNVVVDLTDHDFDLVFTTSGDTRKYVCSRRGDTFTNCRFEGTDILCIFDNHRLNKGQLQVTVYDYAPDATYPDGVKRTVAPTLLDIYLIDGEGDGVHVTAQVAMDVDSAIANANQAAARANEAAERCEELLEALRRQVND